MTGGIAYAFGGDFAKIGGLNVDPSTGLTLDTQSESAAAFLTGWQYLWLLEPSRDIDPTDGHQDLRGLGLFAIAGWGEEDTNPVQWSLAGGLSGRGLIPGRCNDTCGAGYFYNRLGDPAERRRIGPLLETSSHGFEAYYSVALAGSVDLTLDFQWLGSAVSGVEDAIVLGARLGVDF